MRLFFSYSGSKSRAVAEAFEYLLYKTLPSIQIVGPYTDIAMGQKWRDVFSQAVKEADIAIVFVTADNIEKPWLLFEIGYLATQVSRIVPYLLDILPSALSGPLANYQVVSASPESTKLLFRELARLSGKEYISTDGAVDLYWPMFESKLRAIPEGGQAVKDMIKIIGDANVVTTSGEINITGSESLPKGEVHADRRISTGQAFERIGAAVRQNLDQLRQNFEQARDESSQFFKLTIIFASIGFMVVVGSVILLLLNQTVAGVVTSLASIIPEVTSALFFKKDKELRKTIQSYHRHILDSQRILTTIDVCETIMEPEVRDRMKEKIILSVLDIT